MRKRAGEGGRSDHDKRRRDGRDCRDEDTLTTKAMSNQPALVASNQSGEGGLQMIRKSGGGNGKERRIAKGC